MKNWIVLLTFKKNIYIRIDFGLLKVWFCQYSIVQTIPDDFLENHQLSDIVLEYRRECSSSDVVQSLSEPHQVGILESELRNNNNNISLLNGFSLSNGIIEGNGILQSLNPAEPSSYTHLLQTKGNTKDEEIVRGRTIWKRKFNPMKLSA